MGVRTMKDIEKRIIDDGEIIDDDIIRVDSFLNHQIDVAFLRSFAKGVKEHYGDKRIDKIVTCETSGIAVAFAVAQEYGDLPLVFAKKSRSKITRNDFYNAIAKSFTRGFESEIQIAKKYLHAGDNVLIVDDFLADGNVATGLLKICKQANANVVGATFVIEKAFQKGHSLLEAEGIDVFVGASIKAFENKKPVF